MFLFGFLVSCEKNPCKNADCGVHAVCNGLNGECACIDGYTKDGSGKCTVLIKSTPCAGVDCVNGTCDTLSGACKCYDFYEKDANGKCTVPMRDKYLGTYNVTEQGTNAASPYTVTITASAGDYGFALNGHGGYTCGTTNEKITLTGGFSNNLGINFQFNSLTRYCGSIEYQYSNLYMNPVGNTFTVNYQVSTTNPYTLVRDVTATFTKQ